MRRWLRGRPDAFERGAILSARLTEERRTVSTLSETYRVAADLRWAAAAERAAVAQERMAELLAAVEHGGTALLMLSRLQEGLVNGPRRPLPGLSLPAKGTSS
jgi:hypothetical protein